MVKQSVQEISTSGAAGGYLTKYAYRKKGSPANISQYLKMGYKPVNQSAVRKKSKGFEYVDLYKD
jgi:ABC-type sulfate transport system substrate-binding protein